jgi:hypothetical protein
MARTGEKDRGSRKYTAREAAAVLALLQRHVGPQASVPLTVIEHATRLPARTVRKIINDADGDRFTVGYEDELIFCTAMREESRRYTYKLEAQARTMWRRIAKRKRFEETMPSRQGTLFEDPPPPPDEDLPEDPELG